MKSNTQVFPSDQVDSTLPRYIAENYEKFVDFMSTASGSEERISFGQDILQNLLRYRDFDFYKNKITEYGILSVNYNDTNLSIPGRDNILDDARDRAILAKSPNYRINDSKIIVQADAVILTLVDGYGFPEENGVLLIDDEIILYRYREGNNFYELQRGASGTAILPTFISPGTYLKTEPATHTVGSRVYNLSTLFLCAMLETIHDTFTTNITKDKLYEDITRSSILKYISDFFRSKGSKLGIKALFKMLFGENDVDVSYPGDKMIIPSESTWYETEIMRTVPIPELLTDPDVEYVLPDELIGAELFLKSYNDNFIYGRTYIDYVSSYPYDSEVQYEIYVEKDKISGSIPANPRTVLTRDNVIYNSGTARNDRTTITVETTLGFPNKGILFIENEGIYYESKTHNQFLNCQRGYIGVERYHDKGTIVYGPYYLEGQKVEDGKVYVSRSWPLGLVSDVNIKDPGLLHTIDDIVEPNGPGRVEPREPALASILENYDDDLATQYEVEPKIGYIGNYTHGPSGVYFDDRNIYVASSNLPEYMIGTFSTDDSVGPDLEGISDIHAIPRRTSVQPNDQFKDKGYNKIGVFVDGVPAYSNVSADKVKQGCIGTFVIINPGINYVNPTVLANGIKLDCTIEIDKGKIQSIGTESDTDFIGDVAIDVVSGRGAVLFASFDRYGRLTNLEVVSGGEYYFDVPLITLVDHTGTGKGAVIKAITTNGEITDTEIVNSGIDYRSNATEVIVTPIGSGAEVQGIVQYYQIDRPFEIENSPTLKFDEGGGHLYEPSKSNFTKSRYGFVRYPNKLADKLGDDGSQHSPLLGWAYDGNPIYGQYGWRNKKNAEGGVCIFRSGYVMLPNRDEIIPAGSEKIGTAPPSEDDYPMGSFVEDYEYNPDAVTEYFRLNSEDPFKIITDVTSSNLIVGQPVEKERILDENNGMITNTPEFPEEVYPDGVYCYFMPFDSLYNTPVFPYIVGKTFGNRPISQNLSRIESETILPLEMGIYDPQGSYDSTQLVFDYEIAERFRNPYLTSTKGELSLKIADISTGSINEIITEFGGNFYSKVGDILLYDNKDTGGSGAEGEVSFIKGEQVKHAEGQDVRTVILSHTQTINLYDQRVDGELLSYVFVEGTIIQTNTGVIARVISWDSFHKLLKVKVGTKRLITWGDIFFDNREQLAYVGEYTVDGDEITRIRDFELSVAQRTSIKSMRFDDNNIIGGQPKLDINRRPPLTFFSVIEPNEEDLQAGDLWWSQDNGRLYIYYNDGDTSQWVCTQPTGMVPLSGSSDTGVGTLASISQIVTSPQEENYVTISTMAPDKRSNGTPNEYGDLWWSSQTGFLYMYFNNEWMNTDPVGTIPMDGASDKADFGYKNPQDPNIDYEGQLTVMVKFFAPTIMDDGSPLRNGLLWWCPLNGKLFIYFKNQWVIAAPIGIVPTPYALDFIPDGGGVIIEPPLVIDPEEGGGGDGGNFPNLKLGKNEYVLWFENLEHFFPGDHIRFYIGAPGTGTVIDAVLVSIIETGTPAAAVVRIEEEEFSIPDRSPVFNQTRSLYNVTTWVPHNLRKEDIVRFENSAYDEVNDDFPVIKAGTVVPATGRAKVVDGEVTEITITDPGKFYKSNFYIWWYGGGGTGGYAYAVVDSLRNGGGVLDVTVLHGGYNYTAEPYLVFGDEYSNLEFSVYTSETYGEDPTMSYCTSSLNVQGTICHVDVSSPGVGYKELPRPVGIYKKEVDRAITKITPDGTKIGSVEVIYGGLRYRNPKAVFIDALGNGSGAEATVEVTNKVVTSITVTDGGQGYLDPYLILIEDNCKFASGTDTIGKIKSFKIIDPGRKISADRSLKPELVITTRLVLDINSLFGRAVTGFPEFGPGNDGIISVGDTVWQGVRENPLASGVVSWWDEATQVMTLDDVMGVFKEGEIIYVANKGTDNVLRATVLVSGHSDCAVVVDGVSAPLGRFINEKSFVSSMNSVIQDSYYYQWFSYVISSPITRDKYYSLVSKIIHPTGFIMFSDLTVRDECPGLFQLEEETKFQLDKYVLSTAWCEDILVLGDDETDGSKILLNQQEGYDYPNKVCYSRYTPK